MTRNTYLDPHDPRRRVPVRALHRTVGSIPHCTPAPHDPTLLELAGIGEESTAEQYCNAIDQWLAGTLDYEGLLKIKGARRVL